MKNFVKWLIPVLFLIGILIVIGTTYNKLLDAVNYKPYTLDSSFVSKEYVVNVSVRILGHYEFGTLKNS